MTTSVGVIAHSAKTLGGGLAELRKTLSSYGIDDPLWREVPKSRFIPKQMGKLLKAGAELIFVWGGDGTVQRVIDAVAGTPATLAVLPAGTANLDVDAIVKYLIGQKWKGHIYIEYEGGKPVEAVQQSLARVKEAAKKAKA